MKAILTTLLTSSLLLATGIAHATVSSCTLKNGSAVSVDVNQNGASYTHTSKAGKTDLTLPATAFASFSGASGNTTTYYRFQNGDYSYVVISVDAKGYAWDGLTVYKGMKRISQQSCKDYLKAPLAAPDSASAIHDESDSTESETFIYTPQ
ncbi:hypothetical protein KBV55_003172 [Salmonella enterica]|nr:hypothetical protein [Salmonella enterica]EAW2232651.1 hypothetical protein [Salmonella enterica subsp. enterica]EEP3165496.1 hypothetical protein [Salmonella enterica subsp. houtenae serovar 43:z4,z32:-]EBH3347460.1 hypothetical protein [Salmonella enterica]EBH6588337.1 hypothetical protein [Salmonella enterica]